MTADDLFSAVQQLGTLGQWHFYQVFNNLHQAAIKTVREHFAVHGLLEETWVKSRGIYKYVSPDKSGEERNAKIDASPDHGTFPALSRVTKDSFKKASYFNKNSSSFDEHFACNMNEHIGNNWNGILKAFLDDLFRLEKSDQLRSYSNQTLANCYSFDVFWVYLQESLNNNYQRLPLERKHLPNTYSFKSDNPNRFFASLRLARRSRVRKMRQCEADSIYQETSSVAYLNWQFTANHTVLERQQISPNLGCSDYVDNLGNYSAICELLKKISSSASDKVNDGLVAKLIRQTLQGKNLAEIIEQIDIDPKIQKRLLEVITNLTYLLFGTEVIRNPASLIIHQMILDLILIGETNFEEMFGYYNADQRVYGDMPMAIEHAVSASRQLNNIYQQYMFFPYEYHGADDKGRPEKIYDLEADIIKGWLVVVKGFFVNSDFNNIEVENIILEAWDEWFELIPDAVARNILSSP